jgi:hypothetical protein
MRTRVERILYAMKRLFQHFAHLETRASAVWRSHGAGLINVTVGRIIRGLAGASNQMRIRLRAWTRVGRRRHDLLVSVGPTELDYASDRSHRARLANCPNGLIYSIDRICGFRAIPMGNFCKTA